MAVSASPAKVTLSLRGLSIVFLFASITLLFIGKKSVSYTDDKGNRLMIGYNYKAFPSYEYMVRTGVIGMGYNLLQIISFKIFRILMKNDSDVYRLIEFYGDKVVSFLLATGSAAGFGATRGLKKLKWKLYNLDGSLNLDGYFNMIYASATLLFLAFLCTAILSILSSYALPKKF